MRTDQEQKEAMGWQYAILRDPGHNRVFYRESLEPVMAELSLACKQLDTPCSSPQRTEIGGISYLVFSSRKNLSERDLRILSRLSFALAFFGITISNDQATLLHPIPKSPIHYLDPGISSLMKYRGKTNELFTRMMLNVALLSAGIEPGQGLALLDPVAGRGTTIFEAMALGLNAHGIEQDKTAVHDASVFLRQYLEAERFKHHQLRRQVGGSGKKDAVFSQEFKYARSKDEFKDQERHKTVSFINGDARYAHRYFGQQFFDLIVGDLPYGISHGNKSGKGSESRRTKTRNPLELLTASLPAWNAVLKPGGAIVVAWNANVLSAGQIREVFREQGFQVPEETLYGNFCHQVDRAIKRDIVVALKQSSESP